jgi:hypothetical protein
VRTAAAVVPLSLALIAGGVAAATPEVSRTAAAVDRAAAVRAAEQDPRYPLPAPPVQPRPCVPQHGGGGTFHRPKAKVKTKNLPAPVPVTRHRADLSALRGKGMWLTTWADSKVDIDALLTRAKNAGLTQIWVRTGGSRQGWYGRPLLTRLLPKAHAAGIAVVAWDFPFLSDPMHDVARAKRAILGTFGGERIDGFSPDIETIYEGTFNSAPRVRLYLSHVRQLAGDLPIVSTVMRPSAGQRKTYPYRAQVPYIDAFAPMVYWGCHEPGAFARESVRALAKWRPVHLIGQSYDMGSEGGPRGVPPRREIWRFLDVAKREGAIGASLYTAEEAGSTQWTTLGRYPWAAG